MKKLGLLLFVFAIISTSCDKYYYNGTIEQEVVLIASDYHLSTVVKFDGKEVLHHLDNININTPDGVETLKQKRYKEAIALIDKLRVIDEIEVSKK